MPQYVNPNAFGNAFARQVQIGQAENAFAAQQAQQAAENARADERLGMERQQFQAQQQQISREQGLQSIQTVSQVARRALGITDPAQRKSYLQYAIPAYAKDFAAIGANVEQGLPQMLSMPDGDLEQKLQQVAQLAAPEKPIEVSAGASLVTRNPNGTYSSAFTAPSKGEGDSGFTLSPEQIRFDAKGNVIARGGPKDTKLSRPEGFDIAAKLRNEYNNQAKEFTGVADSYQRIRDSAADPSAAGDLALIFNYMKVLDPGSTVREGEFATAQNAGGVDERVISLYNRLINGERLAPGQREDFVNRATRLYKGQETRFNTRVKARYEGLARRYGLEPEEVISDPTAAVPSAAPPAQAEITATGPNGEQIVLRNGQWVPK